MSKDWQENNSWPVSQTVLSWVVVILFVVLAGDWSFIERGIANSHQHAEQAILPGTPEHDQLMSEMAELVDSVKRAAKDGILTTDRAAEVQMQIIASCAKAEQEWGDFTAAVFDVAQSNFIASWTPPQGMDKEVVEMLNSNPERKRYHLDWTFRQDWMLAQDKARRLYPETKPLTITPQQIFSLGKWLIKWYWLLTIPSLIIFLLNRRYEGRSVAAELLLQPRRLALACLFGPFGLMAISDTAAKAYRYRKLKDEFYAKHGRGPNDEQEQAIRRQVEEPLLQFEQALELARTSSERVRRPLAVCAIAWVLGLMSQPTLRQILPQPVACEALPQDGDNNVKSASDDNDPSGKESLLAILPAAVGWQVEANMKGEPIAQENVPRDVLWEAVLARGPPPAAEEQLLSINDSALDCTTQKGYVS